MPSQALLNAQTSELIALDDGELDLVAGGGRGRGGAGWRGKGGGGFNNAVQIDLDLNIAVIAGNLVLSDGGVSFVINQS